VVLWYCYNWFWGCPRGHMPIRKNSRSLYTFAPQVLLRPWSFLSAVEPGRRRTLLFSLFQNTCYTLLFSLYSRPHASRSRPKNGRTPQSASSHQNVPMFKYCCQISTIDIMFRTSHIKYCVHKPNIEQGPRRKNTSIRRRLHCMLFYFQNLIWGGAELAETGGAMWGR
jgi:hypothetical protein